MGFDTGPKLLGRVSYHTQDSFPDNADFRVAPHKKNGVPRQFSMAKSLTKAPI
jgi:hypothetical protein